MEPAFQVWLLENGLQAHGIAAADLPDGQRGIVATRTIQPGTHLWLQARADVFRKSCLDVYVCVCTYTASTRRA